jgi:hypothetical protein
VKVLGPIACAVALLLGAAPTTEAGRGRDPGRNPRHPAASRLDTLRAELARSSAGRGLLEALQGPGPGGEQAGLELLAAGLEREVCGLTGVLVDASDLHLLEAAGALRRVPRGFRREPLAAVMVLLDEWAARTPDGRRRRPWERVVERLRGERAPSDPAARRHWLAQTFPLIAGRAERACRRVGLQR